jgi:hypothetical protein
MRKSNNKVAIKPNKCENIIIGSSNNPLFEIFEFCKQLISASLYKESREGKPNLQAIEHTAGTVKVGFNWVW